MMRSPFELPAGRIDIHCHLLPGIDDGSEEMGESLEMVRQLKRAGYVASICTPHIWPEEFPGIVPERVRDWTGELQAAIDAAGLDYAVYPGGEVRLSEGIIPWMEDHGVPLLGESRCVLVDCWFNRFPRWFFQPFEWLLKKGYRPILAHPERMGGNDASAWEDHITRLERMGVWLQGNLRCFTGEDGYFADQTVRKLMKQRRYHLLALDAHRSFDLPFRLDGLSLAESEFGREAVEPLVTEAPREMVLLG